MSHTQGLKVRYPVSGKVTTSVAGVLPSTVQAAWSPGCIKLKVCSHGNTLKAPQTVLQEPSAATRALVEARWRDARMPPFLIQSSVFVEEDLQKEGLQLEEEMQRHEKEAVLRRSVDSFSTGRHPFVQLYRKPLSLHKKKNARSRKKNDGSRKLCWLFHQAE